MERMKLLLEAYLTVHIPAPFTGSEEQCYLAMIADKRPILYHGAPHFQLKHFQQWLKETHAMTLSERALRADLASIGYYRRSVWLYLPYRQSVSREYWHRVRA